MPRSSPGAAVDADWFACLPQDKWQVFQAYSGDLEAHYLLLTVSLNECIGVCDEASGRVHCSGEWLQLTATMPVVCLSFANYLQGILSCMEEHVMRYKVVPNAAPLSAANFRGRFSRRTARVAGLLARIQISPRARFLRKVSALKETIRYVVRDFCEAAHEAATTGENALSPFLREKMDSSHFDLNTCLRETRILLKSFLRALPEEQLLYFQQNVESRVPTPTRASRKRVASVGR